MSDNNGWISVKERLPEKDGKVTVFLSGEVTWLYFCRTQEGKNGGWVWWWYHINEYGEPIDVPLIPEDGDALPTLWQPLPSPPKGE